MKLFGAQQQHLSIILYVLIKYFDVQHETTGSV